MNKVKIIPVVLLISVAAVFSCSNKNILLATVPECIRLKVDSLKAAPKANPPGRVDEYQYDGKLVYLFASPCCDQYNLLYDASCNVICAPSGGITGKGDGRCAEFDKRAVFIRTIWKDER